MSDANEDGEWERHAGHLPMYASKKALGDEEMWDCAFNPTPDVLSPEHSKFVVQEALMRMVGQMTNEGAKANNMVKKEEKQE